MMNALQKLKLLIYNLVNSNKYDEDSVIEELLDAINENLSEPQIEQLWRYVKLQEQYLDAILKDEELQDGEIIKKATGIEIDGNREFLVLRHWNEATPFVIHYWRRGMGYYWGAYLPYSDLEKAKAEFEEKWNKVKNF